MRRSVVIILGWLLASGCANFDREAPPSHNAAAARGPARADGKKTSLVSADSSKTRKIIRRGELHVTVKDYGKSRAALLSLLKSAGGYIASSRVDHSLGRVSSATFVLRIPADGFSAIAQRVAHLGTLTHETINSEDITSKYTDLAARLKSKQRLETRLLELVTKKTDKIAELLAVERELARVRGEIERMQGQLRMYDKLVALATLTVRLDIDRVYVPPRPQTFGDQAGSALERSFASLAAVGRGALLALVALLPWIVPLGGLTASGVLLVRRRRRRRRDAQPTRKPSDDTQPGTAPDQPTP